MRLARLGASIIGWRATMMKKKRVLRNVAVAYPAAVPWVAMFIRGIADYAERVGGWNLTTSPPAVPGADELMPTVYNLRGWTGDGVIAAISNANEARAARRLSIPVVNIAGAMRNTRQPRVMVDHYAIGRMAADHLFNRGHRRLAYCGFRGPWYSQQRCLGFAQRAEEIGASCDVFLTGGGIDPCRTWTQRVGPLIDWLRKLTKPVGLLAVHDYRARIIVDECARIGLNVPHDVAILGVDNDLTVCEFCRPTLSSVSRNGWRMGYEAASMLDTLMAGKMPPAREILIPPDGVVGRQSTDTVAVADLHVAAAMHFMRDHADKKYNIAQLADHLSMSRRQLELRFRHSLGCSPYECLCRLRVERAKNLLACPSRLKLQAVARACGFSSEERMRLVFLRLTGTTPGNYRRERRMRGEVTGCHL